MYDFAYHRPGSLADAARLAKSDDAKLVAGGMTLIPTMKQRLARPSDLIDLGGLKDLAGIKVEGGKVTIGALTPHGQVAASADVKRAIPALAALAGGIGDPQVRNCGTLGGSLAHADPAADLPAVAAALDATYVVQGPSGRREVSAADFSVDLFTTALAPDEVLVEVRLAGADGWSTHYEKFHRMAQAWAIVGVAVAVSRSDGAISGARVALSNMGPVPHRAVEVEAALTGSPATPEAVAAACVSVSSGTSPVDDLTASADYRRDLARVLTARAVCKALGI